MSALLSFPLYWVMVCFASDQMLVPNGEVALAYHSLERTLAAYTLNVQNQEAKQDLLAQLGLLRQAVSVDTDALVDRHAKRVDLESEGPLFEPDPVLPKENKTDQTWTFEPQRFEVVPGHLFLFDLRFKADRTIRVRSVRLIFRDGTEREFKDWMDLEHGNGKELSRNTYTPKYTAWSSAEAPQARALKALEILGSAQDGSHEAALSFSLSLPDPSGQPFEDGLALLDHMQKRWEKASFTPGELITARRDMESLKALLGL